MTPDQTTGNSEFEQIQVKDQYKTAINKHFKEEVAYSFISGGFTYGGAIRGKSDIDIVSVFFPDAKSKDEKKFWNGMSGFVDDYLSIHKQHGYVPDITFPGEYITTSQVQDAIAGRGFQVSDHNRLYLDAVTPTYYLEDSERWYRAWLSQSAFSDFITGDRELFLRNKEKAWKTVSMFNLLSIDQRDITTSSFLDYLVSNPNKKVGSGVHSRYRQFRQKEQPVMDRVMHTLVEDGVLTSRDSYVFTIQYDKVYQWENNVSRDLRSQAIRHAPYLIDMRETSQIGKATKNRWQTIYEGK